MITMNWMQTLATSPTFLVLIACSVVTLGVALERAHYFFKRRGNPDATLEAALIKVRSGDYKEAAWACQQTKHPLASVAAQVLEHRTLSTADIEEKMQIALSEQKLLLERNLGFLGTMAGAAPLIGLLGTVWGIMRAFHDMAQAGTAAPSVVAAGVSEALVTTAAGLVVAVPALVLYNHFSRQMNVMLTVAENHSRSIRAALTEKQAHDVSGSGLGGERRPSGASRPAMATSQV
jgi:biopolymer transport protein ExbB